MLGSQRTLLATSCESECIFAVGGISVGVLLCNRGSKGEILALRIWCILEDLPLELRTGVQGSQQTFCHHMRSRFLLPVIFIVILLGST